MRINDWIHPHGLGSPVDDMAHRYKQGWGMTKPKRERHVWKSRKPPYQDGMDGFIGNDRLIFQDEDGWIDFKLLRPRPYELTYMKTPETIKKGWWTGNNWDGSKIEKDDKVIYWKYKNY